MNFLTKPAKELLLKAKAVILAEPRQFDMAFFFRRFTEWDVPNCGTTACIAGWLIAISRGMTPKEVDTSVRYQHPFFEACELLGIDEKTGDSLFYSPKWPEPFRTDYHNLSFVYHEQRAKIAANRIDYFLETDL